MKYVDRIFDSIFGFINLTEVEKEIINTPIFQRLHHINQLGMANIIFPNAVHTRFAHSLGVMHIMDKMVSHIRNLDKINKLDDKEHQTLRLAALLHDIGHFPFSHLGERATSNISGKKANEEEIEISTDKNLLKEESSNYNSTNGDSANAKLHERLSQRIVQKWKEINVILSSYGFESPEIGRIIVGSSSKLYHTMLLHSELDADRLDYLLRDSSFLGVSYGNIELEHIISTLDCKINKEGIPIIGITEKGLHAVEHYILARYFMYSQIIYYPKMCYLEKMLQEVYEFMIESSYSDIHIFNEDEIKIIIDENNNHKLYSFNDHYLFYRMRLLHDKLDKKDKLNSYESIINENIKLLLSGQIPEPIMLKKVLNDQKDGTKNKISAYKKILHGQINNACEEIGLPENAIFYDFYFNKPTKMRSFYGPQNPPSDDEREEAIRIIYNEKNKIGFLIEDNSTILSQLSGKQLQLFYIFANNITLKKKGLDFNKVQDIFKKHINLDIIS